MAMEALLLASVECQFLRSKCAIRARGERGMYPPPEKIVKQIRGVFETIRLMRRPFLMPKEPPLLSFSAIVFQGITSFHYLFFYHVQNAF